MTDYPSWFLLVQYDLDEVMFPELNLQLSVNPYTLNIPSSLITARCTCLDSLDCQGTLNALKPLS
jgi:hypothetical protein